MTVITSERKKGFKRLLRGVLEEGRGPKSGELEEHRRKLGEPQSEMGGPQKEL